MAKEKGKSKSKSGAAAAAVSSTIGRIHAKTKSGIRSLLDSLTNSNGSIDATFLFFKVLRVIAALIIMTGAHYVGVSINARIDRHMRAAEQERRRQLKETSEEDDAQAGEDGLAFRSRNTMAQLGGTIAYIVAILVGFLVVLRVLGVEIATIVAMLSTVGFVVGFAVQGTLSDVAAGVLLALFQTYEVGDIIKLGEQEGRVIDFRVVNTLLQDIDTLTLVTVPNRVIQESVVVNYSRSYFHIYQFFVILSNQKNEDFPAIIETVRKDLLDAEKYPSIYRGRGLEPAVNVNSMDMAGTRLSVKVHLEASKIWEGRGEVRTGVRALLEKEGVVLLDRV